MYIAFPLRLLTVAVAQAYHIALIGALNAPQDSQNTVSRPLHPRGPPILDVSLPSCARNARKAKTQRAHTSPNSTFAPVVDSTFHLSHVTVPF